MIKSIEIQNFRSIDYLYLEPQNLSVLLGPNSVGKSNVLKALDLVLGEGWASKAKVARELFRDADEEIEIVINFESPITYPTNRGETDVYSVELFMKFKPELKANTTINGGNPFYYQNNFKNRFHFQYIPADRNFRKQMKVTSWSLLGKIMQEIYDNYVEEYGDEERLKNEFKQLMEEPREFLQADFSDNNITFKNFVDTFEEKCKRNSLGLAQGFTPRLHIYNLNWFYKTLQIHIDEGFEGREFNIDDVGTGMKNLVYLSIIQTYAELMGDRVIFGIEEPELFLYPQAQRSLYSSFKELSENSQIFYTTHSVNFVDPSRADEAFILHRKSDDSTGLRSRDEQVNRDFLKSSRYKIYSHFNQSRNEIFFANKLILVEGDSDKILFETLFREKWDIDLDKKGASIIECGGKGGVLYFIGVCRLLGLNNFYAVWDEDDDNDISDEYENLAYSLGEGRGLEVPGNLDEFLDLPGSNKIKNAHKWALEVSLEDIPEEFVEIKDFIETEEKSDETGDLSDDISSPDSADDPNQEDIHF